MFIDMPTCCGSTVPHIATIPTGSFSRTIASSSFNINHGVPMGEDPYPPGRITDLRVERQIDSSSEVKLSWTAPGGDYDKGKGMGNYTDHQVPYITLHSLKHFT
jgi:hypothetical protein